MKALLRLLLCGLLLSSLASAAVAQAVPLEGGVVAGEASPEAPRLELVQSEGKPLIKLWGTIGETYVIEHTRSLRPPIRWEPLVERTIAERPWAYALSTGLDEGEGYYRARTGSSEPPGNPDPDRWAWIPPGTFTMGSPSDEAGRYSDEGPQTRVTLSRGFWLGKTEVTIDEYRAFLLDGGDRSGVRWGDWYSPIRQDATFSLSGNEFGQHGDQPMVDVSWHGAVAYCEWLTARERSAGRLPAGYEYGLPTEAQWEYACRAGTTTRFSFGDSDSDLGQYGWYSSNSGRRTHPVGQKLPNAWGLYDMHGNVYEWCADWYGDYPGGSVTDPTGPTTGSVRVNRGGGWSGSAQYCRSANRIRYAPSYANFNLGFRVALVPVP